MHLSDSVKPSQGPKSYVRVKVTPRQPKTELFGTMSDGTLKIRIRAIPEKGKANEELLRFFSQSLGIDRRKVEILSGAGETVKLLRISWD